MAGPLPPHDVTAILHDLRAGKPGAAEKLMPLVYDQLRAMAGAMMRDERASHTLQPTALVNEAFVRLAGSTPVNAEDRGHFMALAATLMRHVLVDHARAKRATKRGGGQVMADVALDQTPDPARAPAEHRPLDVLDLDDAMQALAQWYPRAARVVELRFFGGLSMPEIARSMDIALPTVERDWALARGWLRRHMEGSPSPGTSPDASAG